VAQQWRSLAEVRADLENRFPHLQGSAWKPKSPLDDDYNCFAWGGCDSTQRWEPSFYPRWYWPIAWRELSIPNFIEAFATLGYRPCALNSSFEFGFQKIAIFADEEQTPTHIARQHLLGLGWLSKLGDLEDIFHRGLHDVRGDTSPQSEEYGAVVFVLKRNWGTGLKFGLDRGIADAYKFWRQRRKHWK
jgi:hypothetical protein